MSSDFIFFIWTTPPMTFTDVAQRCVESICRWHPHAMIRALSNTLPPEFFSALQAANCDISVERYDLATLVRGSSTEVWYDFRRFWSRSAYFPNHEADLLRLLTLRDRGGTYVDTDVIFLRPFTLGAGCVTAVGIESGVGGLNTSQAASVSGGGDAARLPAASILCNAVMRSDEAHAPLLESAIESFVREYVPLTPGLSMLELHQRGEWGAMGPLLLTRVVQRRAPHAAVDGTCVLAREVFYPIAPAEMAAHFAHHDVATWERLHARSVSVHLWNALTKALPLRCGSLVHRLLEENCVACVPLRCA